MLNDLSKLKPGDKVHVNAEDVPLATKEAIEFMKKTHIKLYMKSDPRGFSEIWREPDSYLTEAQSHPKANP